MNKKDKLIESTLLALQGKLELNEKVNIKEAKAKVQEDVEVETNDAEVTVGEDTTIIETDEATVTVEQTKKESCEGEECIDTETAEEVVTDETFDDTPLSNEETTEDEVVEVPVEGEETIVPEVDVDTDDMEECKTLNENYIISLTMNGYEGYWGPQEDAGDNNIVDKEMAKIYTTREEAENAISYIMDNYEAEDVNILEESKEIKTENTDPRPYETKMYDLIEDGLVDTAQLAKELLGFLEDDDIKRFMEIYEYTNLTESKECSKEEKEECEDKITKFSSKSFNEAFTKMYKEKYKTVESFKTTKVTLGKDTLKVEGKVLNKDGLGKEVKFEMKQVSNKNGVVRFQQQNYTGLLKESKNSTLRLLATTNNKVLECRYILSK